MDNYRWLTGLTIALTGFSALSPAPSPPNGVAIVRRLLAAEDSAVITGNRPALDALFVSPAGPAAENAWRRSLYFTQWAKQRGLQFDDLTVTAIYPQVVRAGTNAMYVNAAVGERFQYHYRNQSGPPTVFGIGVYHRLLVREIAGVWKIESDDCFPPAGWQAIPGGRLSPRSLPAAPLLAAQDRALAYANRYCGAAAGCGNHGRYNPLYPSYNQAGGDCTAFISQILRAAGFAETERWHYDTRTRRGTAAWTTAGALTGFLVDSGRVSLIARGNWEQVVQATAEYPQGALALLRPGDLITDFRRGSMQHSAMVVGFDRRGYPLVNAHFSDRFRVPWDINWDNRTTFYLWRVHYGLADEKRSPSGSGFSTDFKKRPS